VLQDASTRMRTLVPSSGVFPTQTRHQEWRRSLQGRRLHLPSNSELPIATTSHDKIDVDAHELAKGAADNADLESVYKQLVTISTTIREADEFYYYSNISKNSSINATATKTQSESIMSDAEYDALARQEAQICQRCPDLLARLEEETGLGSKATRFGGRVGPLADVDQTKAPVNHETNSQTTTPRIRRYHLEKHPMLSLDNALTDEDVTKWLERVQKKILIESSLIDDDAVQDSQQFNISILVEPKLDGLSLSLRYRLTESDVYVLEWGATRGDGTRGEDVTDAIKLIRQSMIPHSFSAKDFLPSNENAIVVRTLPPHVEVRGEVILPIAAFKKYNQQVKELVEQNDTGVNTTAGTKVALPSFANARNAASGILQRTRNVASGDTKELCAQLHFYAYDVVLSSDDDTARNSTWNKGSELQASLARAGFSGPTPSSIHTLLLEGNQTDGKTSLDTADVLNSLHKELVKLHAKLQELRPTMDVEVDGQVYKVNEMPLRDLCGSSTRAPRWAIAHKFPSRTAISRLLKVELQVGRTGSITPVAILEPVNLGGITVSRASLHNFDWMNNILSEKNPGSSDGEFAKSIVAPQRIRTGTPVFVSRAGDVIPQVVRRVPLTEDPFTVASVDIEDESAWISLTPPEVCPKCGSPAVYEEITVPSSKRRVVAASDANITNTTAAMSEFQTNLTASSKSSTMNDNKPLAGGRVLRCSGPQFECDAKAVAALAHTFSRDGLDVSGLSEARIEHLRTAGMLRRPSDLFELATEASSNDSQNTTAVERIAELPGWGPKSAANLLSAANTVANEGLSLDRFIYSLGIRFVGKNTAKLLASHYKSVDIFLASLEHARKNDTNTDTSTHAVFSGLMFDAKTEKGIKGIGPVVAASLSEFATDEALVEATKNLAREIKIIDVKQIISTEEKTLGDTMKLPFAGLTIVFTGTVPGYTRTEAQELAQSLGAKATPGTVSKSTSLVVQGDNKKGAASKLAKAEAWGVQIIDASEFLEMTNKIDKTIDTS
jgi:DNA ligase (NAD+)